MGDNGSLVTAEAIMVLSLMGLGQNDDARERAQALIDSPAAIYVITQEEAHWVFDQIEEVLTNLLGAA